jgi:hypothetical protein
MKILRNKTYQDLLNQIEHKDKSIVDLRERLFSKEKTDEILKLLAEKTGIPMPKGDGNFLSSIIGINGFNTVAWDNITLPDTVLQYVDDILGGKVIKQEGTKCLVIDKDGNVKTGLTKQKADKGFSYKLVRI